jgi:hypothetical protein
MVGTHQRDYFPVGAMSALVPMLSKKSCAANMPIF